MRKETVFVSLGKKRLEARHFLLFYLEPGKKLISRATLLITSDKQDVHLTYPSSLLSIGSRETLETLRSLDVPKTEISTLRGI